MRLAAGGLQGLLKVLKESLVPRGVTDGLLRYGPDAGFALYSAAAAPGGFNPMVGVEDLGISLLGSVAGSTAGSLAGRRLARGLEAEKAAERISQAQQVGDLLVSAPLQLAAPRPFLESAIEQNFPKPAAQKQQSDAASDREMQEALLLSLLTAGTTGLGVGV
jgi:hypothetical protein